MKKSILLSSAFLLSVFFMACSSSKNTTASKKDIRGTWTLTDIKVSGLPKYEQVKITIFDDVDINCFKGSEWSLPNNNYGSYTISKSGSGCTTGARNIVWSNLQENGESIFQFKKLQEGVKAKNIEEGYRLKILSVSSDALSLQSQVRFENKTLTLDYQFTKK